MEEFLTHFTYIGIVGVLIAGSFGLPLPEDIPLLLGGYMAAQGVVELEILIPLCLGAVIVGDSILWFLGNRYHWALPRLPLIGRFMSPDRLNKARKALADHGGKFLFAARFMPGLRAVCFAAAGALHVPYWKLLLYDGLAALVSVPTLILVAWYFADHIEVIKEWSLAGQLTVVAAVALVIAAVVLFKRMRRSRVRSADQVASSAPSSPVGPAR